MKKISKDKILIAVIYIAAVLLVLLIYSKRYEGWKTVPITENITFKIPEEWVVTWENNPNWAVKQGDNVMYITDRPMNEEGYKIYLAGTLLDHDTYTAGDNYLYPYELFENVEFIERVRSAGLSNSGMYFLKKYNISGNIETRYNLNMSNPPYKINFIAWDNSLDEDMIIKITKTFSMSDEEK